MFELLQLHMRAFFKTLFTEPKLLFKKKKILNGYQNPIYEQDSTGLFWWIVAALAFIGLVFVVWDGHAQDTTEHYSVKAHTYRLTPKVQVTWYEAVGSDAGQPIDMNLCGGGGVTLNKGNVDSLCYHKARCGYSCFSTTYRLNNPLEVLTITDQCVYKDVQDVKMAIRFIKEKNSIFGCDTTKTCVSGLSWGGILALSLTYNTTSNYLQWNQTKYPKHSVTVDKCVSFWGAALNINMFTKKIPNLLIQGTADQILPYNCGSAYGVPVCGSLPINQKCNSLGIPSTLIPYIDYKHGLTKVGTDTNKTLRIAFNQSISFLYK